MNVFLIVWLSSTVIPLVLTACFLRFIKKEILQEEGIDIWIFLFMCFIPILQFTPTLMFVTLGVRWLVDDVNRAKSRIGG